MCELRENERIDDLQVGGLRIIQHARAFRFGMDAVLLADFARVRPRDRVADLGTGTGILALLLCARAADCRVDAVEVQPDMADMAARSVRLNNLSQRVRVIQGDLRFARLPEQGRYDLAVCNPPYGRAGASLLSAREGQRIARHEGETGIADVTAAAGRLLRNGGRLAVVFPAARMLELMDAMRQSGVEPKRLRLVYPYADRPPNLALLEGVKQARPMLHVEPPLIVYERAGAPTAELRRIYHQEEA